MNRFQQHLSLVEQLNEQWEMCGETRDWLLEQYENPKALSFYHKAYVLEWVTAVSEFMVRLAQERIPQVSEMTFIMPRL